jgi:hypothetical protein
MKAFKLLAIAAAMFAVTSCVVEEGGYKPRPTAAGHLIYRNTESRIRSLTTIADLAIKLDKYIIADETERMNLTARFFPNNAPSFSAGTWSFQNSYFTIQPDSKSLHETGAKWNITSTVPFFSGYSAMEPGNFQIECTGTNTWRIIPNGSIESSHFSTTPELSFTGNAPIPANSNPYALYDYSVTGEGHFTPFEYGYKSESLIIDYEIKSPFIIVIRNISGNYVNIFDRMMAKSGKCDMIVTDSEKPAVRDNVTGEIINASSSVPSLKITFNGVSEIWN